MTLEEAQNVVRAARDLLEQISEDESPEMYQERAGAAGKQLNKVAKFLSRAQVSRDHLINTLGGGS
jgi:hypothetical protein